MSDIALSISLLSLVAVLGLWIGNCKIRGVGLGIGGVLFGGLIVGHFAQGLNIELDLHTLHFIQEFGLILFVYTIGIQVGPGFFASLRCSGMKLNGFAVLIVALGGLVSVVIYSIFEVPLAVILGVFSGAVTNTPSLGAGQQILSELGMNSEAIGLTGMGYAVAYPFGICGILLTMWLLRLVFKIDVAEEADKFEVDSGKSKEGLLSANVELQNTNLEGLQLSEVIGLIKGEVICSRLKRGEELIIPKPITHLKVSDCLHLVGDENTLNQATMVIGKEVKANLSTKGTEMRSQKIVVTNENVLGKKISELGLKDQYDVVVSRINRAGVELVPNADTQLQFGDILNLLGHKEAIDSSAKLLGNAKQKLKQVQMLPIFLGVGLGILLGSLPIYLPGLPAAIKLGLAGGPLLVALVLSRIGSIGRLYWFMPPSASLALREMGIVLFLAVVGLKSGGGFIETLVKGDGLSWMGYGVLITFTPLVTIGVLARIFGGLNYLTICGMLAGAMTDPPALAFANGIHPSSGAPALSYATVYPLVMCLRILLPQLLAIALWAG
ncbi:putative transporter [Vibrio sp. WXL210]|uniref:putative transporter n=1 Tax=Vibrio sp. WXL210 TaxID=3450709 RepID=UPI003EC8FA8F